MTHATDASTPHSTAHYETVIGLEVHAQLNVKSKLFCPSSTQFGDAPNTNISPVTLGLPGALPVLNKAAVRLAVMAGAALNCTIHETSVFARKNYFYPDLPKGYQISQFELPICTNGHLNITTDGVAKTIGITRIHMEEDAGKLLHQGADSIAGAQYSLVDLNRAGIPLIEIVSEPDIRSAKEARAYLETLHLILVHLGINDGNLEEGSLRCDANISLRPTGSIQFGTRTEVKNLNSFRSLERAINAEVARQTQILDSGGTVIQQTRNYDDATQKTTPLRDKEEAHDYRYFPDPDLLPLRITPEFIHEIRSALGELPDAKQSRFQSEYGLSEFEATVLIQDTSMLSFFESCESVIPAPSLKDAAKWIVNDMNAFAKQANTSFSQLSLNPTHLHIILESIASGKISGKMAKDILLTHLKTGESVEALIQKSGGSQISDETALIPIVESILDANIDIVEKVKQGKTRSADFLMGQVMRETKGRAKPDLLRQLILECIEKRPG